MPSITSTVTESTDIDALLGRVELMMRGKALVSGVKKSLEPALERAQQLVPAGGPRVGKKAGKKHLRDTLKIKVIDYGETVVGLMGAEWPAGNHAHNVEFGHAIRKTKGGPEVGRAAPHPFMRPAAAETQGAQIAAFEQELAKHAAEASK